MNLNVHQTYVCFSETGCTISLRDGTPCKDVPAHTPTLFVAQQPDMVCSDPAAVVRELPNGVELLHGEMMKEQPATGVNVMKYAHCVTVDDMLAVNADYKNDLHGDGEWVYPLPAMKKTQSMFSPGASCPNIKKFLVDLPNVTNASMMFYSDGHSLSEAKINFPKLTNGDRVFRGCNNLVSFTGDLSALQTVWAMFWNCRKLRVFDSELPNLRDGREMFTYAQLNKKSFLKTINSIPKWTDGGTHRFEVGIHVDNRHDEEVLEAIANAEAKGWTLTIQWNGTPTAQAATTYGLRKPPIYARVNEMERHDGTTERVLDWGHYVTDPSGYEEFRSVEAAREYYGLPEESLTNN